MVTIEQFRAIFPPFRHAPAALVETIVHGSTLRSFAKGACLYADGDACSGVPFVLTGEIRVFKVGEGGREFTLYEILPGETCIMNAACILSRQPYPANAFALADSSLLYLDGTLFRDLVALYEEMRTFIFRYFSTKYTEIIDLIEAMAFQKVDVRLTEYLITKAANNTIAVTHQKIANDLGTSREVISRLLKEMEHKGKVRLGRNQIKLLAPIHR